MTKFAKLLENKKMSQRELGKKLNLSSQIVNYWATGRSIPRIPEVIKIACCLNTSIEEVIFCFTEREFINGNKNT